MIKFSASIDKLANESLISRSPILSAATDWSDLTPEEADLFYYIPLPEGKRRKPGTLELEDIPPPTDEQLAQVTQSEMITELNWCDLQMKLHASSDSRSIAELEDIYAHARACRDHVKNIEGVLTIVGDKPARPE